MAVIQRYNNAKVVRSKIPTSIREQSEVAAAYAQVGEMPRRGTKSWYRDIYEFYQDNEY